MKMEEPGRTAMTHRNLISAIAVLVVVLVAAVLIQAMQDRSPDPLAPSGPAEVVARSARLAGLERAVTAEEDGTVSVALDVPRIVSAADVELAYQVGFASLASAWPAADVYVVRLRLAGDSVPLAELTASGPAVRDAVTADDAASLVATAQPQLLAGVTTGESASPLPAEEDSPDTPERLPEAEAAYLDAKNRATRLLDADGPQGDRFVLLAEIATQMRQGAPRVSAPSPGQDAADIHSARIDAALAESDLAGADDLRTWLASVPPGAGRDEVALMRAWAAVTEALTANAPLGSVLAHTAALAEEIAETPVEPGAPSEAVLAAAGSPSAPASILEVEMFERVPDLDWSLTSPLSSLPGIVLPLHGSPTVPPELRWTDSELGPSSVAPDTWLAYRRADGPLYWLAGESGPVALTERSLLGWAFSVRRAALVDAANAESVRAIYRVE